ncbi:hypothetical protein M427DRAFT_42293 [Gonapodya prolifera JEL478]|uniref:Uncharacterized protein n=1 Tax=Gonapodya prolifera (strain JEL478) TaxID=1344416 RepID=A0A139APK2_GONPJ|nr:hypothetical protein M427DRAFT_42293 [Gonapodya prolifera JEL478]|eukprot:KXS18574.1 hypothetical protein M427DRAFT_42293 [Gonapodya prolifera JEL478]
MAATAKTKKQSVSKDAGVLQKSNSFIFPEGSRYDGEFKETEQGVVVRNGFGKFFSPSLLFSYAGEWQTDQPHGRGTATYFSTQKTGPKSVGERKSLLPPVLSPEQLPISQGSIGPSRSGSASSGGGGGASAGDKMKSGSKVALAVPSTTATGEGSSSNASLSAPPAVSFGAESKANPAEAQLAEHEVKAVYEGSWKEGKYCGQGRYGWSDGTWYAGEWVDGR